MSSCHSDCGVITEDDDNDHKSPPYFEGVCNVKIWFWTTVVDNFISLGGNTFNNNNQALQCLQSFAFILMLNYSKMTVLRKIAVSAC